MQFHAQLADAIQAPTEFRLLNNGSPITVGRPEDREKKGLSSLFTVSIQDNKLLLSFFFYISAKCIYVCMSLCRLWKIRPVDRLLYVCTFGRWMKDVEIQIFCSMFVYVYENVYVMCVLTEYVYTYSVSFYFLLLLFYYYYFIIIYFFR